jgi:ubiquitin-protein ligase
VQVIVAGSVLGEKYAGSSFEFKIRLTVRWPFVDPQIYLCQNNWPRHLADGRDLFNEVVGQGGWKKNHTISTLVTLMPEFIEEILDMEEDRDHVIGKFHLG